MQEVQLVWKGNKKHSVAAMYRHFAEIVFEIKHL